MGDDNEGQYKPEVRVVEIFQLIPVTHTIKNSSEKSLLYNHEVIKNLFKILSIDSSEEDSNLVILHSQVQIIKVISSLFESEYKSLGTHSIVCNDNQVIVFKYMSLFFLNNKKSITNYFLFHSFICH